MSRELRILVAGHLVGPAEQLGPLVLRRTPRRPAITCSGNSHDTCSTKSPAPSAAAVLTIMLGTLGQLGAQPFDGARG